MSLTGERENAEGMKMARNTSPISDLETRRQTLGWSIKELGDRCGIDETILSDWEHGRGSPRLDAVQNWAAALGLKLELVPVERDCQQGLLVDWDKRCIKLDGTPIRLTPMEWKALERLAWTPGELVTHQALFHHLYGDERQHRAQSTAVRVLITKLRRLLPIRIEAQWGQGYVISGLAPSRPLARIGNGAGNGGATPQPEVAETPRDHVALTPQTAPRNPPPIRRELVDLNEPETRRVAAAPTGLGPRRAEELGVIERFLAERGVTRCPDLTTIQQSPLPTLIWDKVKRKWVRPSFTACEASGGPQNRPLQKTEVTRQDPDPLHHGD
jgi:transcriptional regulator with XRE-family HTH domain